MMKLKDIGPDEAAGILMVICLALMFVYEYYVGFDLGFRVEMFK